jgi:hypothetical protein
MNQISSGQTIAAATVNGPAAVTAAEPAPTGPHAAAAQTQAAAWTEAARTEEARTDEARTEEQAQAQAAYEACDQCGAPVDAAQRYCVVCGTRRKHAYDPAAQFLSGATSRARAAATSVRSSGARRRRSFGLGTAAVLAAIPLAVAAGVLVGRSGNSADQKLLAALRAQKPTVVNVGQASDTAAATTATTAAPVSTSVATKLSSDFSLTRGYAVALQTLAAGATQATVTGVEQAVRAKGATAVGLISQSDFKLTPSPPAGDYVIYSGQYKSKAAADAALGKLAGRFPGANVIAVQSSASSSASTTAGAAKVLSSSSYGSAHQVTGFKPTSSQLAAGGQIASKESKETNSAYVNGQNSLPDVVSVP